MTALFQAARNGKQIIRRKQLEALIGLSRSTIYSRINPSSPQFDAAFPKPIKLGTSLNPAVGWLLSEVESWLDAVLTNSRQAV